MHTTRVSKTHPSLRTANRFHSHRAGAGVERDAPFAYKNVPSSSGCIAPYDLHSTDDKRLCQPPDSSSSVCFSAVAPHHPSILPALSLSEPPLSPGCFSTIFVSVLSTSVGFSPAKFVPALSPSPGQLVVAFVAVLSLSLGQLVVAFVSVLSLSLDWSVAIVVSVPDFSLGCFVAIVVYVPDLSLGFYHANFFSALSLSPANLFSVHSLSPGFSPAIFFYSLSPSPGWLSSTPCFVPAFDVSLPPSSPELVRHTPYTRRHVPQPSSSEVAR